MSDSFSRAFAITRKEWVEAGRDRFFTTLTGFLLVAALISVVTGSIALSTDVATYSAAKDTLLALGKSLDSIALPEFYPLKLLRGAIEQIEIVGSVLGILIGYRSASGERGRQTLPLVLTRPVSTRQFMLGKALAGFSLIALSLLVVFGVLTAVLALNSGVALTVDDLFRVGLVWILATFYVGTFFLITLTLALWMKRPSTALLTSFVLWLLVVLIAPQIGDTLDPDNQVAGGVFKQLHVPKAEQDRIKLGYAGFETIRNGIEAASVTKHFERASFAVLGIKDSYTGKPLNPILHEKQSDILWIIVGFLFMTLITLLQKLNFQTLTKEH